MVRTVTPKVRAVIRCRPLRGICSVRLCPTPHLRAGL